MIQNFFFFFFFFFFGGGGEGVSLSPPSLNIFTVEALRECRPSWPRQIITPILPTVKMLSLICERLPTPLEKKYVLDHERRMVCLGVYLNENSARAKKRKNPAINICQPGDEDAEKNSQYSS